MTETIKCDICGQDYEIDASLFSPLGSEHVAVRLNNFERESVQYLKYNTCPECTRKVLKFIENERRKICLN